MYGEIINAIVAGLRSTPTVVKNKVAVVLTGDDEEQTVNTALPAIAITVLNSDNAQVYIGGLIEDRVDVQLAVILDLTNQSWSRDNYTQANGLTIASSIRNDFERLKLTTEFKKLRDKYNFNPLYHGFQTFKRIAIREQEQKSVVVFELKYQSSVVDRGAYLGDAYGSANVEAIDIIDATDNYEYRQTHLPYALFHDYLVLKNIQSEDFQQFFTKDNEKFVVWDEIS